MSVYLLAGVILLLSVVSYFKGINAYDAFIEGCKEGLQLFYSVFPAMLAMIFCVNIIQSSGTFAILSRGMKLVVPQLDSRIIPMMLFRPISGSASLAIMIDLFQTTGVNSIASRMASVIQGSTDTTFYVISLYFSSVGIKRLKHVIPISLFADVLAISLAIYFAAMYFH